MQILRQRGRLRSQVICRRRDWGRAEVRMRAAKERPAAHPIALTCRGIARRWRRSRRTKRGPWPACIASRNPKTTPAPRTT